jgi:hypothetical protein
MPDCEPVNEQRHARPLAARQQHVELAPRRARRDLVGPCEELIGALAHRRDHDDHTVTGELGRDNARGDLADALDVGDRGATVLLHDDGRGHGRNLP